MTTIEIQNRDQRLRDKIDGVLRFDNQLAPYADQLNVTIESSRIVVDGNLPTPSLVDELIPAIRRAGVLSQVCNNVAVAQ
ncbi:hypothetical protein K227x_44430 [Rubripirellula lacrimiformis]|uniref:BON domain-containing protein n=1 Tax=Rubripirellula lacrimiformis TaxID=1930273 RepID=A0A517NFV8_9BACT|nr:hypothetical protein [Rubripirellula lacrimiformis]QDT06036.1 hypothetical protein K227x_44430 [Rubripirellula lacrimiformis]